MTNSGCPTNLSQVFPFVGRGKQRPYERVVTAAPGLKLVAGCSRLEALCYTPRMTLAEITFELQKPLSSEQMRALGEFANTYGLRSFRVAADGARVTFEYDASRLRGTQVAHVLGLARIPIKRQVDALATA